jgi:hypothetical protein
MISFTLPISTVSSRKMIASLSSCSILLVFGPVAIGSATLNT